MAYWEDAGQAIEEMVAKRHKKNKGNWANIVPMDDKQGWGLNKAKWLADCNLILDNYFRIIGRTFDVTEVTKMNAGAQPLMKFQAYLETRASYGQLKRQYYRAKALLVEWE